MRFLKAEPYFIAEIAQAHDGSLGLAHSYIDAVAKTGAHAIKFQTHIAHAESTQREPWRIKFSHQDASRYDYWKRMEFTPPQWAELAKHCQEKGLDFVSSPFSVEAVHLLDSLNVPFFKVGSGEVDNVVLLAEMVKCKKPIVLSTGMSTFAEIDEVYEYLKKSGVPFAILHCTSEYPVKPQNFGLNVLSEFKIRYDCPIGFSSHLPSLGPNLAAVTLGAEIFELHVTYSRDMFGPDASSSMTLEEMALFIRESKLIREIQSMPMDKDKKAEEFAKTKDIFRKSIVAKKALKKGSVITFDDLDFKKPGDGLKVKEFEKLLGRRLMKDKSFDDVILLEDIE